MSGQGQRLAYAIRKRGYAKRADFAREIGMDPGTLRQQINRDSVTKAHARIYARKLKIPLKWLLYDEGADPFESPDSVETPPEDEDVNDSLTPAESQLTPEESEEENTEEGELVTTYTFIRVVGDLERRIGHLEAEIAHLRSMIGDGETPARPRRGRAPS